MHLWMASGWHKTILLKPLFMNKSAKFLTHTQPNNDNRHQNHSHFNLIGSTQIISNEPFKHGVIDI